MTEYDYDRPFRDLEAMDRFTALRRSGARRYGKIVRACGISNREYQHRFDRLAKQNNMRPPPSSFIHIMPGYLVVRMIGTSNQYETWMPDYVFNELYEKEVGRAEKAPERLNPPSTIREETGTDANAIDEVTVAAFRTLEISNHTEQFIIRALRAANALSLSLVAVRDGRVVGHVAFSPVTISDGSANWYGLGPLSVSPDCHRQGIGSALVLEGIARLKGMGACGCCLVGHPEYYRRLGFRNVPGLHHVGVPEDVFLALAFDGRSPQGTVEFHEAFTAVDPSGHQG